MTGFKTAKQTGDLMGLSVKALRLYEMRGLVTPGRTSAGDAGQSAYPSTKPAFARPTRSGEGPGPA